MIVDSPGSLACRGRPAVTVMLVNAMPVVTPVVVPVLVVSIVRWRDCGTL